MEGERVEKTVLFADVVDSTRLYVQHGDESARQFLMRCIDLMAGTVQESGGRVVERIGDEIFCLFEEADGAARAASRLQRRVNDGHLDGSLPCPMRIRIGMEHGPTIETERGVFGATVHTAARLVSLAKAGQTLTTEATLAKLNPITRRLARFFDCLVLKGQSYEQEVHELLWDADATVLGTDTAPRRKPRGTAAVELRYGDRICRVDANAPRLELGRHPSCGLCVDGISVSQLHARILWDRGKIRLEDVSTNGTHVKPERGSPARLHREGMTLSGSGQIQLGSLEPEGSAALIRFRCLPEAR